VDILKVKKSPYEVLPHFSNEPVQRGPKQKLTTIVGIKGKNGIVLCADAQETRGQTREEVIKIDRIGKNCLFGAATNDVSYLIEFEDRLKSALSKSRDSVSFDPIYKHRIDSAVIEYISYVDRQLSGLSDRLFFSYIRNAGISGILAKRIKSEKQFEFELYQIETGSLAQKIESNSSSEKEKVSLVPQRATAGTGGEFARLLLQGFERIMSHVGLTWTDFSVEFIAQFLDAVIGRVIEYDINSKGLMLFELSAKKQGILKYEEVFPNEIRKKKNSDKSRFRLSIIVENAFKEIKEMENGIVILDILDKWDLRDIMERAIPREIRKEIYNMLKEEFEKEQKETKTKS